MNAKSGLKPDKSVPDDVRRQSSDSRHSGHNSGSDQQTFATFEEYSSPWRQGPTITGPVSSESSAGNNAISSLASIDPAKKSADNQVDVALQKISDNLDQSGLFNDVTHNELLNINSTLAELTPEQTNLVISGMSDQQLSTWTTEIDSNGILGTGGLNEAEQTNLFNNLASDLDMKQLSRVHNALDDGGQQLEFTRAISENMSTNEVRTLISDHISLQPKSSVTTKLQGLNSDLGQYENAQTMAKYSLDVYNDFPSAAGPNTLEPGTVRLNPDQLPSELGITKNHLVDSKSGFYSAIYKQGHGVDANYIVAFRGTEMTHLNDWITNGGSIVGLANKQYSMAADLITTLINSVGSENITVTGHSLGGGLANYSAMKNDVQSTAFNPKGTTIRERLEIGNVDAAADKYIQNYQVKGELLTGVQETAHKLTSIKGVGPQDLIMRSPGPETELPAIRPDGVESNLLIEAYKNFIDSNYNIAGPIDRHGIEFAVRGMDELIEYTEAEALNEVFKTQS